MLRWSWKRFSLRDILAPHTTFCASLCVCVFQTSEARLHAAACSSTQSDGLSRSTESSLHVHTTIVLFQHDSPSITHTHLCGHDGWYTETHTHRETHDLGSGCQICRTVMDLKAGATHIWRKKHQTHQQQHGVYHWFTPLKSTTVIETFMWLNVCVICKIIFVKLYCCIYR